MAEITAAMVKALRDETGQGMMDCKQALQEAGGDLEAARDILRRKGLVKAEKKAERATSEGRIAIKQLDGAVVMVEARCETDFCARNEQFQALVATLADLAAEAPAGKIDATDAMGQAVQQTLAKIGENMSYARGIKIEAPRIGAYLHHNKKVGVIVGVEGDVSDQTLSDLCMHIAFADPMGIAPQDIPADVVAKEREFATQEAIDSGKPPQIAEKMVEGKIRKFMAANALLEQPFVRDDKKAVKELLGGAKVTAFARFAVGG
ncbi:MAG TPA: translation elongation factor Ts [Phycisphaerae bacterium]|nr:translation elongation factor Ts [Phycisphaerae bacterium]